MPSAPLQLKLKPSRRLAAFVAVTHFAAIAVLWPLPLPGWALVLLGSLIAVSAWKGLAQALLLGRNPVRQLIWTSDGAWQMFDGRGRETRPLLIYSFAEPWLITLCFRSGSFWQRRCVALLPDALAEDTQHALRLRLRLERRPGSEAQPGR